MWAHLVALLVVVIASPQPSMAQSIVLESFTNERPHNAPQILAPLHAELSLRGHLYGDALGRQYEARISRPALTQDGLTPDFEDGIERGHKAWIAGRFEQAVSILTPLIDAARANPAAIAQNQVQLEKLQKGLTALALAHQRMGDLATAKEVFREVLRSYPDSEISRATYGPDAFKLFAEVRQVAGQSGRGRLVVETFSDQAVVFINERFAKVGRLSKGDMLPGDYRVYVQLGKRTSRVHNVTVKAEAEATLSIDDRYDATLQTGSGYTGFTFDTAAAREKNEPKYAARFANEMRASAVVVIGFDQVRGRPALVGSLVDLRNAREIRRASLALEPAPPSADRVRALAKFLAGEDGGQELDIQIGTSVYAEDELPADPIQPPSGTNWKRWVGIAAIGVGLASGGLAVKSALDGRDAGEELKRVCAVACSSEQAMSLQAEQRAGNRNALIFGAVGGASVITGIVLVLVSRSPRSSPPAVAVSSRGDDIHFSYEFSF